MGRDALVFGDLPRPLLSDVPGDRVLQQVRVAMCCALMDAHLAQTATKRTHLTSQAPSMCV